MKISKISLLVMTLMTILVSCNKTPGFKIEGEVDGASDKTLVLEKSNFNGEWVAIDSVRTDKSGKFSLKSEAPENPDIYRLSLDHRFIYFPIDSVETITLKTKFKDFGRDFTLSGSQNAEQLASFEKELLTLNNPDKEALALFKKNAYTKYIQNARASIVAYYILTKIYNDQPLFDPSDRLDLGYIGAVATQYQTYRPNDPHAKMLENAVVAARRLRNKTNGVQTVVEAKEISMFDIDLPDENGKNIKLSEVAGKGKPVVLIFSLMNEKESPDFNRQLSRIYAAHKGQVEFYQVSFDDGQFEWRDAAKNLPWITVLDKNGMNSNAIIDYNVGDLPAVFILNSQGETIDRPTSLKDLENKL